MSGLVLTSRHPFVGPENVAISVASVKDLSGASKEPFEAITTRFSSGPKPTASFYPPTTAVENKHS
jgi:hypothetical protein